LTYITSLEKEDIIDNPSLKESQGNTINREDVYPRCD